MCSRRHCSFKSGFSEVIYFKCMELFGVSTRWIWKAASIDGGLTIRHSSNVQCITLFPTKIHDFPLRSCEKVIDTMIPLIFSLVCPWVVGYGSVWKSLRALCILEHGRELSCYFFLLICWPKRITFLCSLTRYNLVCSFLIHGVYQPLETLENGSCPVNFSA